VLDLSVRSGAWLQASRASFIALGCCLILSPLWLVTMFGRGLWTPDEPREADISWRMSTQDDRAIPSLAGRPFLEKPPLAYWAAGAAGALFPDRDAALRAPNLLYACIATSAVVLLAFAAGGAAVAWTAGLAYGSFVLALQVAAWLATDAAMMSGVTLALLGFYRAVQAAGARAKLLWYLLMHSGLALAFMAKGPAAWLVPGLAAAGFIALERNWRELRRWRLWVGFAIPACVVGTWLLAVARAPQGEHALSVMLWSNVTGRVFTLHSADALAYAQGHRNWPGKYLVELPFYLLPWTFMFVAAARRAWRAAREPEGTPWRFALCALVLPLIALSLAGTARGIYAAPVMPAAALLIGLWAAQAVAHPDRFDRRMLVATVWLVASVVLALFAATGIIVSADPAAKPFWPVAVSGAAATAITLLIAGRHVRGGAWPKVVGATFTGFTLAVVAIAVAVFPAMDRWQDISSLIRAVSVDVGTRPLALYSPDETLVAVVDRTLAAQRREIARPDTIEASEALLAQPEPPVFLVLLRGRGDGPVSRRLRSLGIKLRSAPTSPAVNELTTRLGLSIERIYELPEGRRYALLSRLKGVPGTVAAPAKQ
jgi:4-amino-4-deoxy-L-arabinose transferase-like glycosyltransferase